MRILWVAILSLLIAVPAFAETKPIQEIDALRLEKADLEVRVRELEITLIKERTIRMIREIQRRDGVEGWTFDLGNRQWVAPHDVKRETGNVNESEKNSGR